jgi:hypothetical protein
MKKLLAGRSIRLQLQNRAPHNKKDTKRSIITTYGAIPSPKNSFIPLPFYFIRKNNLFSQQVFLTKAFFYGLYEKQGVIIGKIIESRMKIRK